MDENMLWLAAIGIAGIVSICVIAVVSIVCIYRKVKREDRESRFRAQEFANRYCTAKVFFRDSTGMAFIAPDDTEKEEKGGRE